MANKYLTTGWRIDDNASVIQGGVAFKKIEPYIYSESKKIILLFTVNSNAPLIVLQPTLA